VLLFREEIGSCYACGKRQETAGINAKETEDDEGRI